MIFGERGIGLKPLLKNSGKFEFLTEITNLSITFEWLNGFLSFKNPKSSEFDVESKNTGKIKLRSL